MTCLLYACGTLSRQGPFVVIDELIELVMRSSIPDGAPTPSTSLSEEQLSGTRKRLRDDGGQDEENGDLARPTTDIYFARQQKRAQTAHDV